MHRGAQMLRSSEHAVAVVAAACGYASPGRFAEAFRRHHGVGPAEYRRAVAC